MSCNNCSTSGSNTFDCPSVTSGLTWDGGSLCNGFSSGNLNDALHSLAESICDIEDSLSTQTYETDNITISPHAASCFHTTTGTLTEWMVEAESAICTNASSIVDSDLTEPLYYTATPDIIAASPTYVVSKTISILADTINEDKEYLKVEVAAHVTAEQTASNSALKVSFMGKDVVLILSHYPAKMNPYIKKAKLEINFCRDISSTQMEYDYTAFGERWGREYYPEVKVYSGTTVSPVDWGLNNNLVVSGYNEIGNIIIDYIRVTKFNIA